MRSEIGIVCGECNTFNSLESKECFLCGSSLEIWGAQQFIQEINSQISEPEGAREKKEKILTTPVLVICGTEEENMVEKKTSICKKCGSPIEPEYKFCGKCGAKTFPRSGKTKTAFFSPMQTPGKAKLILIKGQGLDGISYHLNSVEHIAGRSQGAILFPDDPFLSPKHANFLYRQDRLFVRDEGSVNGIYIRIRFPKELEPGEQIMGGEQIFRVELPLHATNMPDKEGTYFFGTPQKAYKIRLVHLLIGGHEGIVYCGDKDVVTVGREGCDINFPHDQYMSASHFKIEITGERRFRVTDLESKNGTYVRIKEEQELTHGDYLFLGKQLLRVEITP